MMHSICSFLIYKYPEEKFLHDKELQSLAFLGRLARTGRQLIKKMFDHGVSGHIIRDGSGSGQNFSFSWVFDGLKRKKKRIKLRNKKKKISLLKEKRLCYSVAHGLTNLHFSSIHKRVVKYILELNSK